MKLRYLSQNFKLFIEKINCSVSSVKDGVRVRVTLFFFEEKKYLCKFKIIIMDPSGEPHSHTVIQPTSYIRGEEAGKLIATLPPL